MANHDIELSDYLKEEMTNTALSIIFANDNKDVFNAYINIHALDVNNFQLRDNISLLHWASQCNAYNICKELIQSYGISPSITDIDLNTPLHIAARCNSEMAALCLLESGIFPDIYNSHSQTSLFIASLCDADKVVSLLLDYGADVNGKNKNFTLIHEVEDTTALHIACSEGCKRVVMVLMKHPNINLNAKDSCGCTPLHELACKKHNDIAKLLLNMGANINIKDKDGHSPLSISCQSGDSAMSKLFIEFNADIISQNILGNTPIHYSAGVFFRNVKLLLEKGGAENVNTQNFALDTPLHIACQMGCIDHIKTLLDYGARIDRPNQNGNTPLDVAQDDKTRELMLSYFI